MSRPKKEDIGGKRILVCARILETSYVELSRASKKTRVPIATLLALVVDNYFAEIKSHGNTLADLLEQ